MLIFGGNLENDKRQQIISIYAGCYEVPVAMDVTKVDSNSIYVGKLANQELLLMKKLEYNII